MNTHNPAICSDRRVLELPQAYTWCGGGHRDMLVYRKAFISALPLAQVTTWMLLRDNNNLA